MDRTESGLRLRLIHPFGIVDSYPNQPNIEKKLLPADRRQGELLFIGLQGLRPPETISLFLQVEQPSQFPNATVTSKSNPGVSWLTTNWYEIKKKSIVEDSTNNLIKTGIV